MSGDRFFLQLRNPSGGTPTVGTNAAYVATCDDTGALRVVGSFTPTPPGPADPPVTTVTEPDTIAGNVIAEPVRLYQLRANNENAAGLYLCVCDMASEPGDDDEAVWSVFVPGGTSQAEAFTSPLGLDVGLSYAWSHSPRHVILPAEFTGSSVSFATIP